MHSTRAEVISNDIEILPENYLVRMKIQILIVQFYIINECI